MAWNPSPKVAALRDLASRFDADRVICVLLSDEHGTIEAISYGRTQPLCDEAKDLAEAAYEAVLHQLEAVGRVR